MSASMMAAMCGSASWRLRRTRLSSAGFKGATAAALLFCSAGCLSTSKPDTGPSPRPQTGTPDTFAEALSAARIETGAPGAAAAIVQDGAPIFEGASGEAARSPSRPLRTTSLLPLVGVTHMATAVMVMRLIEEGQLSLDDPLERFVPYVPGADRITVRMLLSHRSGLPDYQSQSVRFPGIYEALADPAHAWTRDEILKAIQPDDVDRAPGEYYYSNTDYVALGAAIEQTAGMRVDAFFEQLIAAPLGLERCLLDMDPALAPDVAQGHAWDAARREYVATFPPDGSVPTSLWGPVWTDNGIMCTAREAARFTDALFRGQLVRPETLTAMTAFNLPEGYGLGVTHNAGGDRSFIGHAGSRPGYGAAAWYDRERRLTIVALVNADGPSFLAGTVFQRIEQAYTRLAAP
ncbi:MAG TPA: serine hydrolase domain-containing protein [Vicinamibacteria bacterium]|nr:serine hydrolase domain-containing protein [Vicinamibacteria bacterium]